MYQFENPKYVLNIKLESTDLNIINHYNNFNYNYNGDSGIDLITPSDIIVDPECVGTIDHEIKCEMINLETNKFTSYILVPRSSISKTNFQMANSIGIIDAGYRGNILAKVRNIKSNEVQILKKGIYFQIIAPDLKPIKVNIVDNLSETNRNINCFGSTNKDVDNFSKLDIV
jgi:dUTP pyrophosphatase